MYGEWFDIGHKLVGHNVTINQSRDQFQTKHLIRLQGTRQLKHLLNRTICLYVNLLNDYKNVADAYLI